VEFVRAIFSLFANGSRVALVNEPGESDEAAQARVFRIVEEAKVAVTLKLVGAERIKLRWNQQETGKTGSP
jgi:hypothetical protein